VKLDNYKYTEKPMFGYYNSSEPVTGSKWWVRIVYHMMAH